jgi:hypothetical protein
MKVCLFLDVDGVLNQFRKCERTLITKIVIEQLIL